MAFIRRGAIVLVSFTVVSCVRPAISTPPDAVPACRSAADPSGRPVATPIDWRLPTDPDDLLPLAAWCRGVGPVVIDGDPDAREAAPSLDALTVVSWNTHVGGGDIRAFVTSLRTGALTGGEPVGHFVLLLQEVFRAGHGVPSARPPGARSSDRIAADPPAGAREDIVSVATALGLALYYVPTMWNGPDPVTGAAEDRGNAILSTLPLSKLTAVELPFERHRRMAIAATVRDHGGGELRVASAHLDVIGGPGRLWIFASGLRAAQARVLVDAFGDARPMVVGSDLNTWADGPGEPAVSTLRESFPDAELDRLQGTFRFGLRLDYFFFRLAPGWRGDWRAAGDTFGSDHRPLVARIWRQ